MRERADFSRLIAELQADILNLRENQAKNAKAQRRIEEGAQDELDWAAAGYTIHNLYNSIENYFLRIAKFFENVLSPDTWHRDLISRMTLDIQDVRPALIDRDTSALVHELRAFRHVFRNIYQAELDPQKVALIQAKVPDTLRRLYSAHERYLQELTVIRDHLET